MVTLTLAILSNRLAKPATLLSSVAFLLVSVASADAVTVTSRVAGFVTHVPRRIRSVAAPISVSSGYGSRHRTCESKIQP